MQQANLYRSKLLKELENLKLHILKQYSVWSSGYGKQYFLYFCILAINNASCSVYFRGYGTLCISMGTVHQVVLFISVGMVYYVVYVSVGMVQCVSFLGYK